MNSFVVRAAPSSRQHTMPTRSYAGRSPASRAVRRTLETGTIIGIRRTCVEADRRDRALRRHRSGGHVDPRTGADTPTCARRLPDCDPVPAGERRPDHRKVRTSTSWI